MKQQRAQDSSQVRQEKQSEKKPGKWPKGKVILGICLVTIVFIAYGTWQYSISTSPNNPVSTGLAPNFSLKDINGTQFSLDQFSGNVTIIHFMMLSGCSGSVTSIDDNQLEQLKIVCSNYCEKKPVSILTVALATCASCDVILAQIRAGYGITWLMGNDWDDGKSDIFDLYAPHSAKDGTIILTDKALNITRVYTTAVTFETLFLRIDNLLEA